MVYTEDANGTIVAAYETVRAALTDAIKKQTFVRNNTNAEIVEAINEKRDFVTNDYYFMHTVDNNWAVAVDAENQTENILFEEYGILTLNEDVTIKVLAETAAQLERVYTKAQSKNK